MILSKAKELLNKADIRLSKRDVINAVYIQPDETTENFKQIAEREGKTKEFYVNVYPPDMNYHKIKYIKSLDNFEKLHRTKSLNQILNEHRETIRDPDELKRWDSLPGDK